MRPSLSETITSRNGMFVRECEQVNLMVGCRLLRSTNTFSLSEPSVQITKISSRNLSHV